MQQPINEHGFVPHYVQPWQCLNCTNVVHYSEHCDSCGLPQVSAKQCALAVKGLGDATTSSHETALAWDERSTEPVLSPPSLACLLSPSTSLAECSFTTTAVPIRNVQVTTTVSSLFSERLIICYQIASRYASYG